MNLHSLMFLLASFTLFQVVGGCSQESSSEEVQYFDSIDEAIENMAEEQNIHGIIEVITTTAQEEFLVVEYREDNYFLGEIISAEEGYGAVKITPNVVSKAGFGTELTSAEGNEYTIWLREEASLDALQLSNEQFFVTVEEGMNLSEEAHMNGENALKDLQSEWGSAE